MDVFVFLSLGGVGIFLLVTGLAALAVKLGNTEASHEDTEKIIETEEDNLSDERAIFIIDEGSKFDTEDIVSAKDLSETIQQIDKSEKNASSKSRKHWKLLN